MHKGGIVILIDGHKNRVGQDFCFRWRFFTIKHVSVRYVIKIHGFRLLGTVLGNDDCSTPQTIVRITIFAVHCRTAAGELQKWRE